MPFVKKREWIFMWKGKVPVVVEDWEEDEDNDDR